MLKIHLVEAIALLDNTLCDRSNLIQQSLIVIVRANPVALELYIFF
ncbi:hypothetical protein [Crinalium epipsammum]|nr:hypothetical protein [Crinalium epipsammum]